MKKIVIVMLLATIGICGCGNTGNNNQQNQKQEVSETENKKKNDDKLSEDDAKQAAVDGINSLIKDNGERITRISFSEISLNSDLVGERFAESILMGNCSAEDEYGTFAGSHRFQVTLVIRHSDLERCNVFRAEKIELDGVTYFRDSDGDWSD